MERQRHGEGMSVSERRIHFDPSIRLDNALTFVGLPVAGAMAWAGFTHKVEALGDADKRIEREYKAADTKIEAVFADRMNDQKALMQNISLTSAANIAEIKAALVRIEDKLDRKADKPGR